LARDLNWISFKTPERKCQTPREWAFRFGVLGYAMWGLHLGLGFSTHVAYGGYWFVLVASVALRNGSATLTAMAQDQPQQPTSADGT